jgi:hypothetical protein
MWIWEATAAGFTAIFCITTIRTAGYPYWGSARSWESVSWGSPSATIGAATTEAGPFMGGRTTGRTGRRRLGAPDRRFGRILRRDPWCRRDLRGPTRHRVRGPRIGRHRANRVTVGVPAMAGPQVTVGVPAMAGPQVTVGVPAMAGLRVTAGVRTMVDVPLGRIPNPLPGRADHRSRNPEPLTVRVGPRYITAQDVLHHPMRSRFGALSLPGEYRQTVNIMVPRC